MFTPMSARRTNHAKPAVKSGRVAKPKAKRSSPALPTAYHHGDLERALREAALAALAAGGPDAVSLRDLARTVGVSPAAPYRHFPDKEALLRAVAQDIAARHQRELDAALAEAGPDALSQFRASGVAVVRFAVRHPAHFRVMCRHGLTGDPVADPNSSREALALAQARGEVAPLPIDHITLTARAAILGLSQLIVDGQLGALTLEQADALAVAVTDVLGHGFAPRGAPPAA